MMLVNALLYLIALVAITVTGAWLIARLGFIRVQGITPHPRLKHEGWAVPGRPIRMYQLVANRACLAISIGSSAHHQIVDLSDDLTQQPLSSDAGSDPTIIPFQFGVSTGGHAVISRARALG